MAGYGESSLGLLRVYGYKTRMRLLDVPQNQWVTVTAVDGGARMLSRLTQHGLFSGDRIRILRSAPLDGPLLIEVNGREIALGRAVAEKIHVEAGR
jgi:ferrous iron transport protein A